MTFRGRQKMEASGKKEGNLRKLSGSNKVEYGESCFYLNTVIDQLPRYVMKKIFIEYQEGLIEGLSWILID